MRVAERMNMPLDKVNGDFEDFKRTGIPLKLPLVRRKTAIWVILSRMRTPVPEDAASLSMLKKELEALWIR